MKLGFICPNLPGGPQPDDCAGASAQRLSDDERNRELAPIPPLERDLQTIFGETCVAERDRSVTRSATCKQ
jgi:hypothetical protein